MHTLNKPGSHQEARQDKLEFDRSCSGCADAMTDILNYKAMALRNFERKKERIDSRIGLLGRLSESTVAQGVTTMFQVRSKRRQM